MKIVIVEIIQFSLYLVYILIKVREKSFILMKIAYFVLYFRAIGQNIALGAKQLRGFLKLKTLVIALFIVKWASYGPRSTFDVLANFW